MTEDEVPHRRSLDRAWDVAVRVSAALVVLMVVWAVNAEQRLDRADVAVVEVVVLDKRVDKVESDTRVGSVEQRHVQRQLSEIAADVKVLLERQP